MNLLTKLIDWFIRALEWLWHLFFPEAHRPPNASFTATPAAGTVPLVVTCDASASSAPDGTIASYTWDFGDGQHGTGVTITHTYATRGTFTIQLTVTDNSGATSSTNQTIVAQQANQPPVASFTVTPTTGVAPLAVAYDASVSSDPDGAIASYTWDFGDGGSGSTMKVTHTYTTKGDYTVKLAVADNEGATSSTSKTITVLQANQPPIAVFTVTPSTGTAPLKVSCDASASSDPDGTIASYTWDFGDGQGNTGVTASHVYTSAGSYMVKLTVTDNEGATSFANQTLSVSGIVLPPDPATIAPALDKTVAIPLATATEFLYTGSHPIQTGVAPGTIEFKRAAVLRGKVTDRSGKPLPAVTIAVLQHPEFGSTLTRSDGMFDIAVNGGGLLTITYTKDGYLPVQRQVQVPWQDYTWLNEVVLIPLDSKVTAIDLTSTASLQVARGSTLSDADGTRQATLLFSQGTSADMALPDGTIQHLQQLGVHITEYTVGDKGPQAMPALLPPTSAYTYAFELNADEELASGATTVRFSPPLFYYVENFLNFPVGTLVPVGYYDKEKATWIPSKNGRVIKILSITHGLADLDTDGHNTADNGATLGITDAERQQLAALYPPNQSLWRVPITHLSQPWDPNMSICFPTDAVASNLKPKGDNLPDDTCPQQGSIIESQNQTLGEVVGITGTPFQLHYQSDRVPGRRSIYSLQIPLSGNSIPASLKRIDLEVDVAGRHFTQSFPAMPNQNYTFVWDGKDAYGRLLQGRYSATVRVGYTYQGIYGVQPSDRPGYGSVDINLFAHFSYYGIPATVNLTRQEVTLWHEWQIFIGSWDQRYQGLGSWSLNIHHVYHPLERKLYMGNGKRRGSAAIASCITTVAGVGTVGFSGDGGPATQAQLYSPWGIATGPDGSLYIADQDRIRRVGPDGIISTVVGNGSRGLSGDGGPATQAQLLLPRGIATGPDGSLYISSRHDPRIRRVVPDGIIVTVAGNGTSPTSVTGGSRGDGGPATQAQFSIPMGIAIGPDGSLYIADAAPGYSGIRQVSRIFPGLYLNDLFIPAEDGSEIYVFNNMGRHLRTLDALTGAVRYQFAYDAANHLVEVKDGDGNTTSIEHDASGNPTAIVSPFGQRTSLTLDANGYLACITNPAKESMQFTYTSNGLLTDMTDPLGHVHRFSYDAQGRLLRDENPAGGKVDLLRTELDNGYSVKSISALLQEQTYVVKQLGEEEQYVNSCCGGLETKSEKHSDGTSTTTFPDGTEMMQLLGPDPRWGMLAPLSKQLEIVTPGGLKLTGSSQRAVKMTDPLSLTDLTDTVTLNGQTYTSTYTAATSSLVSTTPTGRKLTTTLDGQGRPVQRLVAGLLPVSYSYDVHGRLHTVTQGTGTNARSITLDYTSANNLDRVTDPLGQVTSFTYDTAERVKTQTLADGRVVDYNYDANANLTALTPPGRSTHTFTYTPADLVSTYTAPAVGTKNTQTQYTYDADRHLTRITHPDGQNLDLVYDGTGRLSSQTTPRGQVSYTYDAATGMMTTIKAPGGLTLTYSYDGALLLSESWTGVVTGSVNRTYDDTFRVTARSVNAGNSISYQYDNDGLLTQAGNLTLSRDPQNGLLTGTTLGPITDTWSYNGFGEPLNYNATASGTPLYSVKYTRDNLGRITQQDETMQGVSFTHTYSFDLAGRLTGITTNGTTTTSYTYDSNGNRLSVTDASGTVNGTYDAQDRLTQYGTTTYTYTANGELQTKTAGGLTTRYEYDMLGNLMTVTLPNYTQISYLVDGLNRRIGKQVSGTLMQGFLYQDGLKPIAELDGSNNLVSLFVYASRSNIPDYIVKASTTYRIIADHLGSPRLIGNVTNGRVVQRMDYDAFGNVMTDTNPGFQPFGFAGGLYDRDTNLIRFGARDYDPETGRWTVKDPIGFGGGDTNLFGYVLSDPVNKVDRQGKGPFGYDTELDALVAALSEAGPSTSKTRREYGGEIYKLNDKYFYNIRKGEDEGSVSVSRLNCPPHSEPLALFHTHPPKLKNFKPQVSGGDKDIAFELGLKVYLLTPLHILLLYDPNTGTTTNLGDFRF